MALGGISSNPATASVQGALGLAGAAIGPSGASSVASSAGISVPGK